MRSPRRRCDAAGVQRMIGKFIHRRAAAVVREACALLRDRSGGALVVAAVLLPAVIGFAGLGVDLTDRKSVVSGKSVSVRVDLGGRRIINKRNKTYSQVHQHYFTTTTIL